MYVCKLTFVSLLLSITVLDRVVAGPPPPCSHLECPSYKIIDSGADDSYEIRNYTDIVLTTTVPIQAQDVVGATKTLFPQLLAYILGENNQGVKIPMAAPVVTQVTSSKSGPSYAVSFYLPQKNHADPPTADGLTIQKIPSTFAAVKQFSGYISAANVQETANDLIKSLSGTKYMDAINKAHNGDPAHNYFVGQYNAPFELFGRTNEIWLTFSM